MKFFHDSTGGSICSLQAMKTVRMRALPVTLIAFSICGVSLGAWEARAALPRWMQDVVSASSMEAALYRVMEIPGVKALYPRPPKEAQSELSGLISKAPGQAELYSLRAMEEEQALDFTAAEADWKKYASQAKDEVGAKLELADYYHRRLQAGDEVKTLMEVGSAAAPSEQYVAPGEQRSWKAFERLLLLTADQGLDEETVLRGYATWIARYPQEPSLYAREFRWLLDQSRGKNKFERAGELICEYRRAFPHDAVFPLKATALLEYRRGSIEKALVTYDAGFEPLWPAELVESYYALLAQTHNQRRFVADARARRAQNPDDLNAMARLFYYSQQQGNLAAAQQVVEAYRLSKENRKANWSVQELFTLASLTEAIHAYPEAARYDFALYHVQGSLAGGASPQEKGLSGIIRILLTAPDQPVELGEGTLSMYRDIATLDSGPGYWNGILSLWLNSASPQQAYHEEEQRAQPYFHHAKAAELLTALDKNYPKAAERAELHRELIHVLADCGESGLVLQAGNSFLTDFSLPGDEANRVAVAMYMADAYARQQDTKGEFALYDRMLTELGAKTAGMPLTAAAASNHAPGNAQSNTPQAEDAGQNGMNEIAVNSPTKRLEKSLAFEVSAGQPAGVLIAGAEEYEQLLERYLGRLTATGQLPQALAVLRKELDRNPNDPLLYERLADFLQQNNLSAQQEEVYRQAMQKFNDKGWYDKLARLYLREKKREAFADLTKQVTDIFQGTELEDYFKTVNEGSPQLFLQLNLYAHRRFPHDELFVRNLLAVYQAKGTYDPAAWEKLMREHWSDSEELRKEFFDYLSRNGKLDTELAQLHTLVPGAREQKLNPAATRELAEVEMWRSHFEESAPLLGSLAEAYPADEEIGTQASSVFRSLAYFDTAQTERAVAVEKRLLATNPADMDRLARIGDIYADSGADSTTGHENIAAAAPYWHRMPFVHPGTAVGYLQAATIFWDYFQFDDALGEIHEARAKFGQPELYGYEAGAIYEGKRDLLHAVHEYAAAAGADSNANDSAAGRLLQLARRKSTAKMVDEETAKAVEANGSIAALELREHVLDAQKRGPEITPLLEAALGKATTFEQAQAIGALAQGHSLIKLYELALQREVALATDPVQRIEISYELARSYEGRKDVEDAARLIDQNYRENPKLLGVVRATADFYWRNKQAARAITVLTKAAEAAKTVQPALSRQFVVEAADKANSSGSYAQARTLMAPLVHPVTPASGDDPYNAQYLAAIADSYARAGDDAGLKQFYLDELTAIHNTATMTADDRKQTTALLRRGFIPALTRMKDYAGAVEQYIAILSAYPEDASAAQEASLYALRYSRQQQLVDFAGNTVKASPRDSRFAILLAQIQTAFENYPAAIDAYARAITIRADRADVYAAKADLEARLQRLDDACREYERLYVLSYQNPDWMVKITAVRARQGRKEDAVKALERAWIEGHPAAAGDYFRVAAQLESWEMLEESLHFAELGVKTEGDALLAGSEPGSMNGDDPGGAVIYARLMTRMRQQDKALAVLDAARKAADQSSYSPSIVVEQIEKQGLASVANDEWRKRHIEQREAMAAQRYHNAIVEMGRTVGAYFTPEEKQQFAELVDRRSKMSGSSSGNKPTQWIDVADAAGIKDEEASLRKHLLLDPHYRHGLAEEQFGPYVQLEQSRMDYNELAKTMDAYADTLTSNERTAILINEADAYRRAGDEIAELRALDKVDSEKNVAADERERYLQLLLKHDVARFESFGVGNDQEEIAFAAPNYAAAHGDLKIVRASLNAQAVTGGNRWENAYAALAGLYFHDLSPGTEGDFHSVLGDQQTVGERIQSHTSSTADAEGSPQLAGQIWFYYGMRYGVYRTLSPQKGWPLRDPEDFLAAGLEHNPSTVNYVGLAMAYADVDRVTAALTEYGHALELTPDSSSIQDAMAVLLWKAGKRDEAIAQWREALAALNRIQSTGPAPESFWSSFALIAQHLSVRKLASNLHLEMDAVLRGYLARNGNYRSNELLKAAFLVSASHSEGVEWILSLSTAASDPAGVLTDIDTANWLPAEIRERVLLREIELARIVSVHAAAHADGVNDYAAQRFAQLQKSLAVYYVEQDEDAKAEAVLQQMTEDQRKDSEIFAAQIELAARSHRLDALLASYRGSTTNDMPVTGLQLLRNAAGRLAANGDKTDALAIWEFVFERGQLNHDLMASDYMGLAEARIEIGNVAGAVELLRRMTLLPGDGQINNGMANYDLAAGLLEKKDQDNEAIEFLTAMAKGVPWNTFYRLRLADAQLRVGKDKSQAVATLRSVAADNSQSYDLRVRATLALHGNDGDAAKFGSEELHLLAAGRVTPQQAQQPYFTAARIAAADSMSAQDEAQRALLLRQAIAISPAGLANATSFRGDDLRLRIFRAEAAARHDATALDAIQPLLKGPGSYASYATGVSDASASSADSGTDVDDGSVSPGEAADGAGETLAELERLAPLPVRSKQTDTEKLALAALIAQVYEHTDSPAKAISYLKLAAYFQKDPALHAELERHIGQLSTALALEAQNTSRRPKIQRTLNQSSVVRPRLTAADLTHQEAQ